MKIVALGVMLLFFGIMIGIDIEKSVHERRECWQGMRVGTTLPCRN